MSQILQKFAAQTQLDDKKRQVAKKYVFLQKSISSS